MSRSDQPKPRKQDAPTPTTGEFVTESLTGGGSVKYAKPTTGEWTDIVSQACSEIYAEYKGKSSPNTAPIMERAINAALAEKQQALDGALRVIRTSQQLLATEREISREWFDRWGEEKATVQQLREQLAAKDSEIDAWHSQFGTSQLSHAIAERDALYAAIAAAQQPLVDSLTLCLSAIRHEPGSSQMRACIKGDAALAKVKQGK